MNSIFTPASTGADSFWSPSRGPTSQMVTDSGRPGSRRVRIRSSSGPQFGQDLLGVVGAELLVRDEPGDDGGTSSGVAPAVEAMVRACRDMWPRWIPSVARARTAAKFCARPTAVMISASSVAVRTPSRAIAA